MSFTGRFKGLGWGWQHDLSPEQGSQEWDGGAENPRSKVGRERGPVGADRHRCQEPSGQRWVRKKNWVSAGGTHPAKPGGTKGKQEWAGSAAAPRQRWKLAFQTTHNRVEWFNPLQQQSPCTKLKSKWIPDFNLKLETLNLIEKKVGNVLNALVQKTTSWTEQQWLGH